MSVKGVAVILMGMWLAACGGTRALHASHPTAYSSLLIEPGGQSPGSNWRSVRLRPSVCEGMALAPEDHALTDADFLRFVERLQIASQVERVRGDLSYVTLRVPDTLEPLRLRVAVLKSAEEAGSELHEAVLQHGSGSWGVHRGNIAILGPIADPQDVLVIASATKLACWGVLTVAASDDAFAIGGGYFEP